MRHHFKRVFYQAWPYFFLCILIVFRHQVVLFRAEFWAEDLTEFFTSALHLGWKSLWAPVYGYYFFLSRGIAFSATFFPVLWTPYLYAACCLVFAGVAIGYFSREGFAWLIPSRLQRVFVCTILAVGPGTAEVFLNLCNLSSVLTIFTLLLLLEKPWRISKKKFLAMTFLIFSAGQTFLLIPVVIYLWRLTRSFHYLVLFGVFFLVAVINFIGNAKVGSSLGILNYNHLYEIPRVLAHNGLLRFFVMPLVGSRMTERFMHLPSHLYWFTLLALLGLFLFLCLIRLQVERKKFYFLALSYLGMTGTFAVIAISRSYALGHIVRQSGSPHWDMRYSYLPGQVALLIWFVIFFDWFQQNRFQRNIAAVAIFFLSAHSVYHWNKLYHRPNLHWPEAALRIQTILDQRAQGALLAPVVVERVPLHPESLGSTTSVSIRPN